MVKRLILAQTVSRNLVWNQPIAFSCNCAFSSNVSFEDHRGTLRNRSTIRKTTIVVQSLKSARASVLLLMWRYSGPKVDAKIEVETTIKPCFNMTW